MIMRLVLIQGISELFQCASVTRQLLRAITSDAAFTSSLPFVAFCHDKQSKSIRLDLHLRTDTHCDDDCNRSNASN